MTDALGHTTSYGYDNNGNRTTVTDALNRITTYAFDVQNRLTTVTDPLTGVTTYADDQASRQTSIKDAVGNTTTNAYDNANRLTTVTDPNGHLTTYAYDNANQLTSVTDRNARQTTYSYDQVGNKTGETWVGGSYIATYAFDAANRLTLEQDSFSKYALTYDNANRLTFVDNNGTPNAPHVTLTYGYDQISNRTLIQDNFGANINLTYDSDNNLTNEVISGVPALNKPTVTLAYDSANRLTNLIRTVVNKNGNSSTITSTFGYDNADRLTGITHYIQGGSTLMTLTYGYDQANQLTSYAGPDGTITYGYDNDGQLTGASGAHNETYSYDKEGNRTLTGYVTSIGNRLTSDGTYSYTYDQDGNILTQTRISDSQVTSYTWDFRNRLTEVLVKTSGGTTVQDDKFTYDVENRRIGKNTLSGGQSWTAYVDANPYADFNSAGSLTFWHLYGVAIDSLLGRVDSSGNTMWYLTDKLGSVRENVDGNGNVLDSITYDTFGNILAETHPTSGDRFKYTSREWDSEIGQYFYRARYYSPSDGRFESEDPSGFRGGDSNLFRFVKNQPLSGLDPTGTAEITQQIIGIQHFGPNNQGTINTYANGTQVATIAGMPSETAVKPPGGQWIRPKPVAPPASYNGPPLPQGTWVYYTVNGQPQVVQAGGPGSGQYNAIPVNPGAGAAPVVRPPGTWVQRPGQPPVQTLPSGNSGQVSIIPAQPPGPAPGPITIPPPPGSLPGSTIPYDQGEPAPPRPYPPPGAPRPGGPGSNQICPPG